MDEGRVLAASQDGAYVIRLEGDVRLTMSTTIDDYFQAMLEDPEFASVWVDLCGAQGIDSTTLGLLAKLALKVRQRYGFTPVVYSSKPGINRLIKSMGFQQLFKIQETHCRELEAADEIPLVVDSEEAVKSKVVEAHRVLMSLSEENRARFKDLVNVLEHS